MYTRFTGGVLLIVGTTIGGGMLALPMVSGESGLFASSIMLVACWALTAFSALLILEANLWFPSGSNLISMAEATLGKAGAAATWLSYILLLYALLAAYISSGAEIFAVFMHYLGLNLPTWFDAVLFVGIFGYIVFRGILFVDYANRILMLAKLGALFILIVFTMPHVVSANLVQGNPRLVFNAITVMLTSFGFANIVPSLRSYFQDDVVNLRWAILIGSFIPLVCYILWNTVTLGALSPQKLHAIANSDNAVTQLSHALNVLTHKPLIIAASSFFTSICVLTAFLCVSLALSDFLSDGLKIKQKSSQGIWVYALTFLPSLIIVCFSPSIFVKALSYAGICCVVLIILLPALMVFRGRYLQKRKQVYRVAGGKLSLIIIILIALVILFQGIKEVLL